MHSRYIAAPNLGDLRMRPLRVLTLIVLLLCPFNLYAEPVKLSRSGICHDTQSPYYGRTKNLRLLTVFSSVWAVAADSRKDIPATDRRAQRRCYRPAKSGRLPHRLRV